MNKFDLEKLIIECLNEVAFLESEKVIFNDIASKLKFPFVRIYLTALGGEDRASFMLTVSTTTKDQWVNGILENSEYGKFSIKKEQDGYVIEHFSGTLPKFRKSKSKTFDDLVNKLNAYYLKVSQPHSGDLKNVNVEHLIEKKTMKKSNLKDLIKECISEEWGEDISGNDPWLWWDELSPEDQEDMKTKYPDDVDLEHRAFMSDDEGILSRLDEDIKKN